MPVLHYGEVGKEALKSGQTTSVLCLHQSLLPRKCGIISLSYCFHSRGLQGSLWDFRTVLRGFLKPPQSPLLSVTHQVTLQVRSHH